MKKCLLFLLSFSFVFLFSSCRRGCVLLPPNDNFKIELESQYNLDEDIKIKISIGLDKANQLRYCEIENLKCEIAYSKENYSHSLEEDFTILYTITDFTNDIYYYTETKNDRIYNFCEQFTLGKEIFNKDSGEFYIYMHFDGFTTARIVIYEKSKEILFLHLKNRYEV